MERIRLWRYKKLANENVDQHKADQYQQERSKKEDYNSCFKLMKSKVRVNLYYITYCCFPTVTFSYILIINDVSMCSLE